MTQIGSNRRALAIHPNLKSAAGIKLCSVHHVARWYCCRSSIATAYAHLVDKGVKAVLERALAPAVLPTREHPRRRTFRSAGPFTRGPQGLIQGQLDSPSSIDMYWLSILICCISQTVILALSFAAASVKGPGAYQPKCRSHRWLPPLQCSARYEDSFHCKHLVVVPHQATWHLRRSFGVCYNMFHDLRCRFASSRFCNWWMGSTAPRRRTFKPAAFINSKSLSHQKIMILLSTCPQCPNPYRRFLRIGSWLLWFLRKLRRLEETLATKIMSAKNGWPFHTNSHSYWLLITMAIHGAIHGFPFHATRSLAVKDVKGSKPSRLGIHGGPLTTALLPWKKVSPEKQTIGFGVMHGTGTDIYIYVYVYVYIYDYILTLLRYQKKHQTQ